MLAVVHFSQFEQPFAINIKVSTKDHSNRLDGLVSPSKVLFHVNNPLNRSYKNKNLICHSWL